MTKQEAIETIRMAIAQIEWEYPMDYAAAFDMATEALSLPEKQNPQSVIFDRQCEVNPGHWERKGFCPKCHQVVLWSVNRLFCGFCGQAVKWND